MTVEQGKLCYFQNSPPRLLYFPAHACKERKSNKRLIRKNCWHIYKSADWIRTLFKFGWKPWIKLHVQIYKMHMSWNGRVGVSATYGRAAAMNTQHALASIHLGLLSVLCAWNPYCSFTVMILFWLAMIQIRGLFAAKLNFNLLHSHFVMP